MEGAKATSGNVLVVNRIRPLNKKEIEKGAKCCLDFNPDKRNITLHLSNPGTGFGTHKFEFDHVFDTDSN